MDNSELLVFGHDHFGHGLSGGKRAYVDDVAHYAEDVLKHCQVMKLEYPGLPLYLVGHSMGGMVAIEAALVAPKGFFQGLVLQGALVIPGFTLFRYIDFRVTPFRYTNEE